MTEATSFENLLVASAPRLRPVLNVFERGAASSTTVLLEGPTGTGKNHFAEAIHKASARSQEPFVIVNCGALTTDESDLFTKNARSWRNPFQQAKSGTLFLDEIQDAPPNLQQGLVRGLQWVAEVAVSRPRVIAASRVPLLDLVQRGAFRDDLFFRLRVLDVSLPPLRERKEDIPALVRWFTTSLSRETGGPVADFDAAAIDTLVQYSWPGNMRELGNVVEAATVLSQGKAVGRDGLPEWLLAKFAKVEPPSRPTQDLSLKRAFPALEREFISLALERTQGNRTKAAEILELSHRALLYKIKEYGIETESCHRRGRQG